MMVETFFEGVQAARFDHGLWELIPLGESVREEALLDVVSLTMIKALKTNNKQQV